MAPKWIGINGVVLIVVLAILSTGAMAQSGCTSVLFSMASCINYVSGSGTTPSSSCCSALANVVQTQPQCLCTIVNSGGGSFGVSINQTRALELPSVCNVQTPPVSRCNVANGPAMSPVESPQSSPDGSPTYSPTGSADGSPTYSPSGSAVAGTTTGTGAGTGTGTGTTGTGTVHSDGAASNGSTTTTIDLQFFATLLFITVSLTSTFSSWF